MGEKDGVIIVPDMPAVDLTAWVNQRVKLTHLDPDYEQWDYYRDSNGAPVSGRGESFRFMVWEPMKSSIDSQEILAYFRKYGFSGYAGAFTAFVELHKPQGCYASIPDVNGCWQSPEGDGSLWAPYSCFDDFDRMLYRHCISFPFRGRWSFVAFCKSS